MNLPLSAQLNLSKHKLFVVGVFSLVLSLFFLFVLNNFFLFLVFILICIMLLIYSFFKTTRKLYDTFGTRLMLFVTVTVIFLFFLLLAILIQGSFGILEEQSLTELLFSSTWKPFSGEFGLFAVIIDTLIVTALSMIIAVPISLLSAIYIAEYAPKKFRNIVRPFIDVLAGVPLDDGSEHGGVASLGIRPTFYPPKELLEAVLFDFDCDLYGRTIEVALHAFLRPEAKFESIEELKTQMDADAAQARQLLA